jgi:hypothetical protein
MDDQTGPSPRKRRAVQNTVAAYGLGLVALYVWRSPRDVGLPDAELWLGTAAEAVLMWAGIVGVSVMFRAIGRARVPRRDRLAARRALTREQRRAADRAIRRRDDPPPPGAAEYARARQALAPVGGGLFLLAAPLGEAASIVGAPAGWAVVGLALLISALGAVLVVRSERSRQALSRWTDAPGRPVTALDLEDAFRTPDWSRWRRNVRIVQGLALAALAVYVAGIGWGLTLRGTPTDGVAVLVVAGAAVAVEFVLAGVGWFLARPYRQTPVEARRLAELPLADRVDLLQAWRRGRAGDPRYADAALTRARSSAPDLALTPVALMAAVSVSLAFVSPLLLEQVPVLLFPGIALGSTVVTGLLLRQSRRQQRVADGLLDHARASAEARRQPLVVLPRPAPPPSGPA